MSDINVAKLEQLLLKARSNRRMRKPNAFGRYLILLDAEYLDACGVDASQVDMDLDPEAVRRTEMERR